MAYQYDHAVKITLQAAADLSAQQYYFVKLDSNGKAAACTAATDQPIGVLQNKPVANAVAEIVVIGVSKVSSDAAITAGALIGTSADGQAVTKATGAVANGFLCGQMLTTTGGANVIGSAIINCAAPARAA